MYVSWLQFSLPSSKAVGLREVPTYTPLGSMQAIFHRSPMTIQAVNRMMSTHLYGRCRVELLLAASQPRLTPKMAVRDRTET